MRELGAAPDRRPGSARTSAAAATRCPAQMQDEVAAVVPEPCATDDRGARRRSTSVPASAPSSSRSGVAVARRVAGAPASPHDLYSYRRDGARPAGWPAWSGCEADEHEPPRRDRGRAGRGARADRRGLRRRRPRRPTRSGSSWSPSPSRPPTSGSSPSSASPTSARTGTRRPRPRPPSAPTSTCAWHFIGGLQSNKAAAVAAYADVVESVDRRKLVGPLSTRGAPAVAPGRRAAPGLPRPAGRAGRVRGRPRRARRAGGGGRRGRACSRCAA